ncbi:uncharacterized protein J7T54_004559 [Emericellopsis cladophorae]|uniref:Cyclase n=1 Tax=Emericellopsis cladophorae TaxID=2686198 RepID=A0A9P9Y6K3_9HYPO|nr:uncharacterized protein J7T54_004559 [Emericellopsis cladophorae]KAI6784013.1 hypothetical protein J7T54_004559 [Emericellopsis cladophorae]
MDAQYLPTWKDLPAVPGARHGFAWGVFDKDGVKDEIGTLNILTEQVVLQAKEEIRVGRSVALNWGLDKLSEPTLGRSVLKHELVDWRTKPGFDFYSWDDEISFNTQTGSQWDGLRHWGDAQTGLYYNGHKHDEVTRGKHLGIEHWTKRGGIVGRGVLLDYARYAERNNIQYSPMSNHAITVKELKKIAKECNITFRPGDILLIRVGWTKWYDEHGVQDRNKYVTHAYAWAGLKGCEETLEWLWDNHFAAVASDNNGVEVVPMEDRWRLHDFLLAGWGMPMGELWDLETLSRECERQQRWTFFLTSAPLNLPGGCASPPNAIAIF